jgi:YebC/PmpR family DNA-binding regulatory protein
MPEPAAIDKLFSIAILNGESREPPSIEETHMSGHSHWAGIKHKKALVDAKRGKAWSKLSKAIIVAAKTGGGDPDMNLRLRYAIDDAKAVSMPKENIQRAVKKGIGEIEGGNLEEIVYEGYAAGGVAILCEVLTDNRNRTAPEIRKIFDMSDGKLGSAGCVAWMFDNKGLFLVSGDKADEDALMEAAIEAGADDVRRDGDNFEVICDPAVYEAVSAALAKAGIEPDVSKITRIPRSTVDLDADVARKVLRLMERLDDHDDVQNVSGNFNIPQEVMAEMGEE